MSAGFTRVLVANRGEIAVRIIRSVHDLGYESVAVYSEADVEAPFVALANRAVPLGEPQAARSYLDGSKVIAAAKVSGADAIHPGYGFLSENAEFADLCREAGLNFIGPSGESIRVMGDKRAAKQRMLDAGVPCIPGYLGDVEDETAFSEAAASIGFPVIVKASAGGGGRGMRVVRSMEELAPNLRSARSEALNAFGDPTVYLEKLVENGRHIEIQVIADVHGNTIHLGERDCSIQRRFQKVIEESPSPFVDEDLRARMGAAAVAAARAVDYVGIGTVEFLVDAARNFYFIEMNTRLQVEHPVTELVTGIDLVELQLRIAAGESLPIGQSDLRFDGHAIEARLYAEDADNDYMPQTGHVLLWRPAQGAGIRIDSGIAEGNELTPYYDAMVAKVIAHGNSREVARRRLATALRGSPLLGFATNRSLLLGICSDAEFIAGEATTAFLQHAKFTTPETSAHLLGIVAALLHGWPHDYDLARWIKGGIADWALDIDGSLIGIERAITGDVTASTPRGHSSVKPLAIGHGTLRCVIDGVTYNFVFARTRTGIEVDLEGHRLAVDRYRNHGKAGDATAAAGSVTSPINGRIIKIDVEPGQHVARGDPLLVIEAMKMEMVLPAPAAGVVGPISVRVGDQVVARQEIVVVASAEGEVT